MIITITSTFTRLFKHILTSLSNSANYSIMAVSKNNPGQRQEQKKRFYKGQEVRASLYVGRAVGQGTYMSAAINNELICDENGKPLPFRSIPWDRD